MSVSGKTMMEVADTLDALILAGLLSVGCRQTTGRDGDEISLRNLLVTVDPVRGIECFDATGDGSPLMSFPVDATVSAASAVVLNVLTGIVTRAIEYEACALEATAKS